MTVISISIIESPIQKIANVPLTITLSTNIPATIFYTLDGTNPDTNSLIVVGPISLPTDQPSVSFKYFAVAGLDTTQIFTHFYGPDISETRNPRSKVTNVGDPAVIDLGPFGSTALNGPPHFSGVSGVVMDRLDVVGISDGYDGTATGTSASETDLPLTSYKLLFSETDSIGRQGKGIGTLPSKTTFKASQSPGIVNDTSDMNSGMFNPKALVIYQDNRKEQFDPNQVNVLRPYFTSNDTVQRDGSNLSTTSFEGNNISGGFLKSYFNPKDNTVTYYYFESNSNRWIKSIVAAKNGTGILGTMLMPKGGSGARYVFEWIPFARRYLFQ